MIRAVLTGFEPATSALTGRRALRAAPQDLAVTTLPGVVLRAPNGIRTRAAALKGRSPRPLDDGGDTWTASPWLVAVGDRSRIGVGYGVLQTDALTHPRCPRRSSR